MPTNNDITILTTGGTIDKEYPKSLGGYAFEFGKITGAHRIIKRANAKINIEPICAVDSQGEAIYHLVKFMEMRNTLILS